MKNQLFILFITVISIGLFSCKKDTTTNNTPNDYYITFDFDGTPVEYRSTTYQCQKSQSGSITVSGGILKPNMSNFSLTESIYVNLHMDEDSVTYNEMHNLIGQNLEVCYSSSTVCNMPVHIGLTYDDGTTDWGTDKNNNPAATKYLKITSVERSSITAIGLGSLVVVEGEFNLVLDGGGTTKNASNGKFRLLFPEYK
ncbi:hypothetical protein [Aureispira anguillae]|uniref:Lipoprotein n=1 Tax=Aureispira anguillae TaxID=2864201 RepID=A0A916DW06_9BACT|nr:hypothetical protein [Aureispira anguillae]BDS14155.1 hypothetical protein AsAng_0049270 [Aureispira anguillae]